MAGARLPIAREGWPFVLAAVGAAVGLRAVGCRTLSRAGWAAGGLMALFFRDPERLPPDLPGAVLAPADGRVLDVRDGLEDPFVGPAREVSIFLSPLDVHINRSPVAGRVVSVEHRAGAFHAAYRPEAADNEQTTLALEGPGGRIVVRQVAGTLARRIVCRVSAGDRLAAGERFGLIRFGSRTDLVVPASTRLLVARGDRVRGGETVMGFVG